MSLNSLPSAQRVHIGFFGMRNAGKSSVVNAVTGQALSIVSPVAGTTTDPVQKAMELLPLGPVVILDTPGMDDTGALGDMRVQRTRRALRKADVAVLVRDAQRQATPEDEELLTLVRQRQMPYVIVYNKADLLPDRPALPADALWVSARTGEGVDMLKERLAHLAQPREQARHVVSDLLAPGDLVVLVTPIDASAPKGRLILPQQQTIRDILDAGAMPLLTIPEKLPELLSALNRHPRLVITDSQAFGQVHRLVPAGVPLTSFSILMARYKGGLAQTVAGAAALDSLKDGDRVLISEGCTHHRQCEDIGTVKLPGWIQQHTGKNLQFEFTAGGDFPDDLAGYALVVHCGGCMLNEKEMKSRLRAAAAQQVPMTNYGMAIAHMNGILQRSLAPFEKLQGHA